MRYQARALGVAIVAVAACSDAMSSSRDRTKSAPPVAMVVVSLAASARTVGETTQATAALRDAANDELADRVVSWSSGNPTVATVSGAGLVTAVAAGTANIIATSEGHTGQAAFTVTAPTDSWRPGNSEPVYDAATQSLILRDDFNGYANRAAMMSAYPVGRFTEHVQLTTGRGGSGGAARLSYGVGGAYDILFGPEALLLQKGGWNGTLPRKAGPYTHFFFTTWFRPSAGSDPAANNDSGIKGFMFWHNEPESGGRYQNAVNRLDQDGRTRGPRGANPDNAESGFNLYKTPDGRAPLWSTYADGQWHRFTIEIYAGSDPSGHKGERYWVDGQLIYDDIDQPVGHESSAGHYTYSYPIRHWMVFGNFVTEGVRSPLFTLDIDDWIAWTP